MLLLAVEIKVQRVYWVVLLLPIHIILKFEEKGWYRLKFNR